MFRIWIKTMKNNRVEKSTVIEIGDPNMTRTHKVYKALEDACKEFDLAVPYWLDINKKEFLSNSQTRFTPDSFPESVDFDYLDFRVIEDDSFY